MKTNRGAITLSVAFIAVFAISSISAADSAANGWYLPSIGSGTGEWSASVGAFAGQDEIHLRNLQLRGDADVAPGLRAHAVIRSNRSFNGLGGFSPHVDEGYLEGYGFHQSKNGVFSSSLRVGVTRYLRFPYPDSISLFDQAPAVHDLAGSGFVLTSGDRETGYNGALLTLDYAHKNGFGAHYTGAKWALGRHGTGNTIEGYGFFRGDMGSLHFEARAGKLQVRPEPVGRSEMGYNAFLGVRVKQYEVGLLYERLRAQPHTGIMVRFSPTRITNALGAVAFDRDRDPGGFAAQLPIISRAIGRISDAPPKDAELVGEIEAERVRTFWQNGQVRNYYEHRVSSWGETGKPGIKVVVDEDPWTLEHEVIVSPHVFFGGDFEDWKRDRRQGPGHITRKVTYRFYREKR